MAYQFANNQLLGVWNVTGDSLFARTFDGGASFYLTQRTGQNPDRFVVRGRNLLNSDNVTMAGGVPRSAYIDLAGGDTAANGLYMPDFATPAGYTRRNYDEGTVYFEANGSGGCVLTNGLELGTFNATGDKMVARQFADKWYAVQQVSLSPDTFVVRGKNILTSGAVTVSNAGCIGSITSEDTAVGGLYEPVFSTPAGYTRKIYPDSTPYYEKNSVSNAAPTLAVVGKTPNAQGKYEVQQGDVVQINANPGNDVRWYDSYGSGGGGPLGVYDATINYTVNFNGAKVYAVNWNNGALGPQSNIIEFVVGNFAPTQSAAPTIEAAQVAVGQPLNVATCPGSILEVYLNNALLAATEYTFATTGINTDTGKRIILNNPQVGQVYKYKQTCPGQTKSNFSNTVTIIAAPSSICDGIVDGTVLGVWVPQNATLKARKFNNHFYVTQDVTQPGGPDAFVVRGRNILSRGDVSTQYSGCTGSFSGGDTGAGGIIGLPEPAFNADQPANYTRKIYPSDGTPYYQKNASPAPPAPTITSGTNGRVGVAITGAVTQGGVIIVRKDGTNYQTITNVSSNFTYTPSEIGSYAFRLQTDAGISDDSVVVAVTNSIGTGSCAINDKQEVGVWNVTGHRLVARIFNGGLYLTQQVQTTPVEQFVVRGRNFLNQASVTSNYKNCTGVFSGGDTQEGGGYPPADFQTPNGYVRKVYSADGTIYYETIGGSSGDTGNTDVFTVAFKSDPCNNTLEYAASKTIADAKDSRLVYQSSADFSLNTGTWYLHAREVGNHNVVFTSQQYITV